MLGTIWRAAFLSAATLASGAALAHDLVCEKTVNGEQAIEISSYPTTLDYSLKVINVHPTSASTLLTAEDALLHQLTGFNFSPAPPVSIPVGGSLTDTDQLHIESFEQCLEFAEEDGQEDAFIDNTFVVTFAEGSAHCSARVRCLPPAPPLCEETVNPHGDTVPPAGFTTLPGSKGGQNEDGFYKVGAPGGGDVVLVDSETGFIFGVFPSGTVVKYTEANGKDPGSQKIGSKRGQAGAVEVHLFGQGELLVFAADANGDPTGDPITCRVPPPPK